MLSSSVEVTGLPFMVESEDGESYELSLFQSPELVPRLWDSVKDRSTVIPDAMREDIRAFYALVLAPSTVILSVEDIGVIMVTDLIPGYNATLDFVFWDKKSSGRQRVVLAAARWFTEVFKLHRLNMRVPGYAHSTLHRLYRLGAKMEGICREAVIHNERWFDLYLFGILSSEFTDEVVENAQLVRAEKEGRWYRARRRTSRK